PPQARPIEVMVPGISGRHRLIELAALEQGFLRRAIHASRQLTTSPAPTDTRRHQRATHRSGGLRRRPGDRQSAGMSAQDSPIVETSTTAPQTSPTSTSETNRAFKSWALENSLKR